MGGSSLTPWQSLAFTSLPRARVGVPDCPVSQSVTAPRLAVDTKRTYLARSPRV